MTIPKEAIEAVTVVLRAHAARILASGMSADASVDDISEAAILAALPHLCTPVAWCRKWNYHGHPNDDEFTDSANLAEQWRTHPQTDAVVPLFLAPPAPAVAIKPLESADIEDLIERLLDSQQDINLEANMRMSQPLCDASALIDDVEAVLRRIAAPASVPEIPDSSPAADPLMEQMAEALKPLAEIPMPERDGYTLYTRCEIQNARAALDAYKARKEGKS